jgi:RimJ/RimL family protein N-acetyltransferase
MTTQTLQASIRKGRLTDLTELVELNHKWFKPNLADIENGFLSVTYDTTFFEEIIRNEDLMLFTRKGKILGYVLVNTVLMTPHIDSVRNEYYNNRPENKSKSIAFSYQIIVDKELQGTGFFIEAQKEYFNYFRTKYDLLVSTVSKENPRSVAAHKKAGWTFIDTPKYYFIIEQLL